MVNMIGESIFESQHQLIEIDDNELRGEITEKEDNRSITLTEDWEIEEPVQLQIQEQEVIRNNERETSKWVKTNLIRLGKVLGVDFQGHEEEALELLLQVDSSRQARKMEVEVVGKKTRFRGSQELKSLVSFDVKFKNAGHRGMGRNLLTSDR